MDLTIFTKLLISLALGLIIGMERGWQSRRTPTGLRSAGVRSFGLVGLFGGVSALLAQQLGANIFAVALLVFAGLVATSYVLTATESLHLGTTTELALLITFVLGALVMQGFEAEAIAIAVITTVLLGFKQEIHRSLERLDRNELISTLQLLVIAAVALPLLPNRDLGPWDTLNPRTIGLLVLLIAGISYVGYFAIRLWGDRIGIPITGLLGGLASSTAVTVALARMAKRGEGSIVLLGVGIAMAVSTMAPRLLVEVAVVNRSLLSWITLPLAILALVPLVTGLLIVRWSAFPEGAVQVELKNPIELWAALGYAAVLTALFVLVKTAQVGFGDVGIYTLSAISGIADVDVVSISLARSAETGLSPSVAARGIMLAALVNTASKMVIAGLIGGWKLGRWCAVILLSAASVSLVTSLVIF